MKKAFWLIFLVLVFLSGILFLAKIWKDNKNTVTVIGPLPTPTVEQMLVPSFTPTPIESFTLLGRSVKADIKAIREDLLIIANQDSRLVPPSFLFDVKAKPKR